MEVEITWETEGVGGKHLVGQFGHARLGGWDALIA